MGVDDWIIPTAFIAIGVVTDFWQWSVRTQPNTGHQTVFFPTWFHSVILLYGNRANQQKLCVVCALLGHYVGIFQREVFDSRHQFTTVHDSSRQSPVFMLQVELFIANQDRIEPCCKIFDASTGDFTDSIVWRSVRQLFFLHKNWTIFTGKTKNFT